MKTTERFEKAVTKLYNAFHKGELNAMICSRCAVGNMCDNQTHWSAVSKGSYGVCLRNYVGKAKEVIDKTGYSPAEINTIEWLFMWGVRPKENRIKRWMPLGMSKETKFKGLCAVVEYLCELDGIPNIMDYTSLFEYNEKGSIKELSL